MSVQLVMTQVLNGLGLGMIYFLLAAGLTIIFGLMRFVNFAHGAFYAVAAYCSYAVTAAGGNLGWALLLGPLLTAVLAVVTERLLLRHTYKLQHEAQILITFALTLLIQELVIVVFGPMEMNVPVPAALSGIVFIGPVIYPVYRIAIVLIAVLIAVLMWLFLERTRFGAVVRAGSENQEMVALLGLNVDRIFMAAFALGAALAGLAGVLVAPLRGVSPGMGDEALGIAFVVVVLGGMGTLTGALIGGLIIGLVQSLMGILWPGGAQLMIYATMALVLLVRPAGLMGRE
ncbi:branched-chain amino acid ABC transporter permease [Paralcaligenes ureilyticus]|uniref:Amino acid/amide ABC transporter membrane protein 1 (HAAT family) n=1 Tax=Paralcaligenes ureilyticus TaxID=627131 RepID=A0A4R3MBM8_9BURK|nr:branched-chain amino acid ABC transporter permease [Paralcaligenes ureilyticus]TCT09659.1 amino acid/amide ABC transporter membrane protein 1 (HAAT family) [Paralcaligenes ureilyticus]